MASSEPAQVSALEKIRKDYLECSICQEEYTEPKILDCLHSFCEHCLLEYQTTNYKDATMLICPLCRKETQLPENGVQEFKTNFILTGLAFHLQQVSSSVNSKLICKLCKEENEATHFCFDCPMIICANCSESHQKIPSLFSHTVATLKDVLDGKIVKKGRREKRHPECQAHEGEVMRFYCTTCDVMICRDCTVIDHCKPQHKCIDCNQASSTCKQSLAQLITSLEEILQKLEQSQATASTMKDNLDIAVERTMAEVKNRADDIRAEVTAHESRIMDEIKNIHKDRNKKFEEYEQTVSINSQQIQHSLQTAKDVSNKSSAPDFLALYPTISKALKFLIGQSQPKMDSTLSNLRFNPGVCDISLGNLIIKEPRWEFCSKYDEGVHGARDIDASLPGDEMAVLDSHNSRVVIYDTKGHQKKTIQLSAQPLCVAAFQNHVVVVNRDNPVKMYMNGTEEFEFYTVPQSEMGKTAVNLQSVAVMNDTIFVGDVKRSAITKHSSSDGSLIDTVSVKTKPHHLAIDRKDRVIVSGEKQQVDIVDDNGATLITIRPTINGKQVRQCTGVCCDSSAIYIAIDNLGKYLGHIHQYDTEGRFLSCISKGLYRPGGLSLTSDGQKLAVADHRSVKIYKKV